MMLYWCRCAFQVHLLANCAILYGRSCQELMRTSSIKLHLHIYICAYNLIRWATLGFKKSRSRGKDEQEKAREGKDKKEDKTLKREKPPHQVWGFSGPFLL